jgi:hypothetical protein
LCQTKKIFPISKSIDHPCLGIKQVITIFILLNSLQIFDVMNIKIILLSCLCLSVCILKNVHGTAVASKSFYLQKPDDPEAIYFTTEQFKITADGKSDVSDALQGAINKVKSDKNFGIVFIPEGTYLISKTIYIPTAIRMIGYGKKRPVIVLGKNSPGYQSPDTTDKGQAKYMIWFTSEMFEPGKPVRDAHAGTFYSALSNIDLKIEDGNPSAVALRTHFAQHSFIAHSDIYIGSGKSGVFDVGNEMEDVRFFGGDYGIYTTKTSPSWQFMMIDTYFEGQRCAAIKTQEAGLTIVRMTAKNVPVVIDIDSNYWEKLIMTDCQFINISNAAVLISNEGNANTQISLRNIDCNKVPILASYRESGNKTNGAGNFYKVKNFIYGLQMDDLGATPQFKTTFDQEELKSLPSPVQTDIPLLPAMNTWVNLKSLGAIGDGVSDDTKVIQSAIEKYSNIYVPQGWYRVTETIKLKSNTVMIGLNPIATQFILNDNTEAFGGFGPPKPLIEAPKGGTNIFSGIGLSTGDYNSRSVACKWMSGANSYLNDVKFIGGHGSMDRGSYKPWVYRPREQSREKRILQGMDPAWDTQHWSLWITDGGGGTFTNIWSANTFAASGVFVSNTSTEGRIYSLSVEHHVRNEVRFKNVSNWKVYALQLEEESRESSYCQPLEIEGCSNMVFANLYLFRVIRVKTPFLSCVRTWDCKNIEFLNVHNYAQTAYAFSSPIYDINTGIQVRPWEFTRLLIKGIDSPKHPMEGSNENIKKLASGFEFADGICSDTKGNIYFCESRMKHVYKWSAETNSLSLVADFPWEPFSLACDSKDNLLVVFKYVPQPGYLVNGQKEEFTNPPDASGTSYSGWGNSGFGVFVYSIRPDSAEESIQILRKAAMGSVKTINKALYPSNRWRDSHDFNTILLNRPKECFVAPDGVTIIPICYDLARANALIEAFPGRPLYAVNEYEKKIVRSKVSAEGYLSELGNFAEKGEYSVAVDPKGNVYVSDGEIEVFDNTGKFTGEIKVPERPITIAFGGKGGKSLFISTATSLYCVQQK